MNQTMVADHSTPFTLSAASVPIGGGDSLFPVHRIYCVGRNYADHAKEMGFSDREAPFFFMKPADAVLPVLPGHTGAFPYPSRTDNLHYEVELVVAIGAAAGAGVRNIDAADAPKLIYGYAIGLDMTRRDLQATMRDAGRPWDVAKGFDYSAPIGPIYPVGDLDLATAFIDAGAIRLSVNGQIKQDGDVKMMIWNVAETLAELSTYYALQPGDLIFTGTPAGVGAVVRGDLMEASIAGLGLLKVAVA